MLKFQVAFDILNFVKFYDVCFQTVARSPAFVSVEGKVSAFVMIYSSCSGYNLFSCSGRLFLHITVSLFRFRVG
jgi:hypothetical protein